VSRYEIIESDCLEAMRDMADNSVDLIATDPPYFKVKNEAWDRQWDTPERFLAWIAELCEQWQRILRPNGSLYVFASPHMRARVEVQVTQCFSCLPTVTWVKGNAAGTGAWNTSRKDSLRCYFPRTEAIIFAEHYGADNIAKGEAGYLAKCDELRGFVFEPLRAYLASEWERAGLTSRDANIATGTQMAGHYLTRSQWALPTRANYERLRQYAQRLGKHILRREYEDLRREYEDLRREYEDLRRPFSVTAEDQFTDVWSFPTVQHYRGKHPCEKPVDLMRHIVKTSTRPGAVVLDCFSGSGATGEAALSLGREFIGIERDAGWCQFARRRLASVSPSASHPPAASPAVRREALPLFEWQASA